MMAAAHRRSIAGRQIRWDAARAAQAYARGDWTRQTLVDAARDAALRTPDHIVIIDGLRATSCANLYREACAMAQAMMARIPQGSIVSFMLPNWAETAVIYLGAAMAGMVVHPILPSLRQRELSFMLADVECRMIFIPDQWRGHDYPAMLADVTAQMDHPPIISTVRGIDVGDIGGASYARLIDEAGDRPFPVLDADAVQMILYTSGTTGTPKGVMHSHNSIGALVRQLAAQWDIDAGSTFLVPSPISHIGGSIYAFEIPLMLGATAILMDQWDAAKARQIMADHGVTHMAGATLFLEQLLAAAMQAQDDLPQLKRFICGGASVPPSLVDAANAHFRQALVTRVYGSTEVPVTTIGARPSDDRRYAAETDGVAGIAQIKLVPRDGLQAGEGEIYVRGPQMLCGYWHSSDEEGLFDSEGYYRTGDLGRWVDGEYLTISGRAKDIIIRKGENISPKEVEDILRNHPDIVDVAIVGVPDAVTGERACAVLVAAPQTLPNLESVCAFLKSAGAASYKIPESLFLWDALPKSPMGKILKHDIRAALIAAQQEP